MTTLLFWLDWMDMINADQGNEETWGIIMWLLVYAGYSGYCVVSDLIDEDNTHIFISGVK